MPRHRAVCLLTVDGLSRGEMAEVLDLKIGDVENARCSFRSKVREARRCGKLAVSAQIRAESARTKTKKAVAR